MNNTLQNSKNDLRDNPNPLCPHPQLIRVPAALPGDYQCLSCKQLLDFDFLYKQDIQKRNEKLEILRKILKDK
jgi:hypothetical protein